MAQSISQEAIGATGLPGATAASRHAGATASGAPTTGTFAVGDYIVDQSGAMYVCTVAGTPGTWQLSGVSVNQNVAGKNFLINGGLDIWQRGVSFTNPGGYTADRWIGSRDSGQNNYSYSQQTSGGITGLPNYVRIQRTSGDTQTGSIYFNQSIETINSYPLANQTVTLSFWARAGANYSATSNTFYARILYGATNNVQMYHYTSGVSNGTIALTLTTSWQRFTYTITIPSTATQVGVELEAFPTGTAGAADYFDIAGVQLEIGNLAGATPTTGSPTAFSRAGGSIGGELALCQRYYYSFAYGNAQPIGGGFYISAQSININLQFPVQMRTTPTLNQSYGSGYYKIYSYSNQPGDTSYTGYWVLAETSSTATRLYNQSSVSSQTAGQGCYLLTNNASAYLGAQAEL